MRIDGPAFVKVEEASIRYFDLGLIDNVLTRPAYQLEGLQHHEGRKNRQDPKFELFNHFGHSINHLQLPHKWCLQSFGAFHLEPVTKIECRSVDVENVRRLVGRGACHSSPVHWQRSQQQMLRERTCALYKCWRIV